MTKGKRNDVEQILSLIDYPTFYGRHVPGFNANGKNQVRCLCPLHRDKEPSLSVNLESGKWKCFAGCGGGTAIQFIQKLHNLSFNEALDKIKEEAATSASKKKTAPKKRPESVVSPSYLTVDQIKILNEQLFKNGKALRRLEEEYGLTRETAAEYLIGFQNDKFVFPFEIEPGKFLFKEHKGYQSKGAKASLYPDPQKIIKEGLPVIVTEAEAKALLLNQLGFPSVTGTAGAGTWRKEWNSHFAGADIILAMDVDPAGKKGMQKTADSLRGTARRIRAIQWPPELDGTKKKKDVTDFFIRLRKSERDFQKLIDNAPDYGDDIEEIDGIRFIQPQGFEVKENGIDQIVYSKDGPDSKQFCHTPLFITGSALDVDTGIEEVEILFKQRRRLKRIWVPKRSIADIRKLIELSDQGLLVNSSNAKRIIEYLSSFEACNVDLIRLSYIAKGVGWKAIRDRTVFVLNSIINPESSQEAEDMSIEFSAEAGFERFVKALRPQGNYPTWKEYIAEALKYSYAAFAFYASFAAPLLRLLKAPNFIIDFWGSTSVGKTTVLELAASVWGNPYKEAGGLVFSWDSTKVFVERMATFFCDVPIFPDDSQFVDDRTLTSILYQIANGVGKGRGAVIGIRRNPTWHTVCFSTGERPLTQCTTFSGAQARTIEIYGSPFPNATALFINDLKQGIRENYGHAGPKFIKGLLSVIHNHDRFEELKNEYKRYQQMLSRKAGSEIGDRISHYFSVVKVAADLVCELLKIGDPTEAEEAIFKVFKNTIDDAGTQGDLPTRAMYHVLSWVSSTENFFKPNETREKNGRIKNGEWIGILPNKLTEVLRKENYSEMAVLRGWSDRGWIKREDKKHMTCSRRITDIVEKRNNQGQIYEEKKTELMRLIIIPWDIVNKFQEKGNQ